MDNQEPKTFKGSDKTLLDTIYAFKKMREPYEPYSYLSRRAYEGKHFTYWNKTDRKLTEHPTKKLFFNQLPEVAKQTDAFENFLVSTNFVFTVIPAMLSQDKDVDTAMYLSMLAHYYYEKLRSMTTFADFVHFSLLDNVSFIEVSPNDQKNDVTYRTWDAFDILFNPAIRDWEDQSLVVKVVKRRIPELKTSKLYSVPADYKGVNVAFNSWKDIYMVEKYTTFATMAKDETLLFECYIKDENGLTIRTLDGAANVLRDDHYPNIRKIPIRPLRIYSGEWYQPSYTYRLIPMNRSLDTVANRLEDLVLRLAKGGWIVQEDENIDGGMNEETGQIIKYSTTKPEQVVMPPIPNFLMEWFSSMIGLSERYGLSSVFSGGLPAKSSGLRAGKMIDQLTGLTQQNNTVTINNLRGTVKDILEFTFQFLYEMWQTPQQDIYTDVTDNIPQFISQKAIGMYKPQDEGGQKMVGIPAEFKRFDVDIDDGMGYTLEERKQTALALNKVLDEFGKPIVSGSTIRKLFKLGSSGYVMEAENASIVDTPEFQELLQLARSGQLTPEQTKAVQITLQIVGTMTQSGQESGANTPPGQVGLTPTPQPGTTTGQPNGVQPTTTGQPSSQPPPASTMPPRVG